MRSGADLGRKSNLGKILRSECRRDVRAILGWQRQFGESWFLRIREEF